MKPVNSMNDQQAELPQQLLAAFGSSRIDTSRALEALRSFVGACRPRAASDRQRTTAELLRELDAVHRREQARLLCAASALRRRPYFAVDRDEARWRADCAEEVRASRQDGVEADYLVQAARLRPRKAWPPSTELARAALALGAGAAGRYQLALAAISEGDPHRPGLAIGPAAWAHGCERCVRALEMLASACEQSGDLEAARRHRRAACEIRRT